MKNHLGWALLGPLLLSLSFAAVLPQNSSLLIPFWLLTLSGSTLLSWFLMALGRDEVKVVSSLEIKEWQSKYEGLEKRLREERKEAAKAMELLELQVPPPDNQQFEALQEIIEEIRSDQERESSEYQAAQESLAAEAQQLALSYEQMRKQFEEKSEALNLSRRELFEKEGQLLKGQREQESARCEPNEESLLLEEQFKRLEAEYQDLELQVSHLQEIVTTLSKQKKVTRKPKRVVQDPLPLIIQEVMDGVRIS